MVRGYEQGVRGFTGGSQWYKGSRRLQEGL